MNWKVLVFSLFAAIIGFSSCENDFDLIAPGARVAPVVYGIVDITDTAHYLRIEKIFVDEEISPLTLAQDPDNLYFDNLDAKIVKGGTSYSLTRVDGNLEGILRDEGIFSDSPNYLYKLKLSGADRFQPGQQVNLELRTSELDTMVTATTNLLGESQITKPNLMFGAGFDPEKDFNFNWQDTYKNSFAYDIEMTVNYEEKVGTADFESKSFVWEVVNGYTPDFDPDNPSRRYNGDGFSFYQSFVDNIPEATNEIRRIVDFDLEIKAVGEEFYEYILIGQVNTGITSAQIIPTYSNLSEGRGIFSSGVSTITKGYTFSETTKEFIREYAPMLPLNFQ